MNKVYLDKELWYIDSFLTEEELDLLMIEINKHEGWYKFPNAPAIRNRFLTLDIPINPAGTVCPETGLDISGDIIALPNGENQYWQLYQRQDNKELMDLLDKMKVRLEEVLPKHITNTNVLQSFWSMPKTENDGGVLNWHYELSDANVGHSDLIGSWTLYINDDFEGGILEFLHKPYMLKPKRGMLVSTPLTKEWTHRVSEVVKGQRHTFHGECRRSQEHVPTEDGFYQVDADSERVIADMKQSYRDL